MIPNHLQRWADPALLAHLDRVRQPWDRLVRRIVHATLSKFLPGSAERIIEIGAGGGQLRDWLPTSLATNTTHTEPSEPFLGVLRQRFPKAHALRADANQLPFPVASTDAALALCVFDTLPDLVSVRDELRRVLRPGGVVVHFLDLATSPDCLFPELIAGGELPLPNFARDPALLDVLPDDRKALLPPADDFDEVLAVDWRAFTGFVGMLDRAGHPLAAELGPYRGLTEPGRLDPIRLGHEFMAVSADPARLLTLNKALLTLTLSARGMGRDWPLRAVSSREHLRNRLRTTFAPEAGFTVQFAGPVRAWEADDTLPHDVRLLLRHAGRTISRGAVFEPPGTPVEELEGVLVQPLAASRIRATTVEVFVTRAES